jgi:hypothetical protein
LKYKQAASRWYELGGISGELTADRILAPPRKLREQPVFYPWQRLAWKAQKIKAKY